MTRECRRTNTIERNKARIRFLNRFGGNRKTRPVVRSGLNNDRLAEASAKDSAKGIAAEMTNPKVQVYNGDVAILTYNYVGMTRDKDGKTEPNRAKSTRVYVKKDSKWMLVHANFAADPLPKE